MGFEGGLSDGCAQLCSPAFGVGEIDWARAEARGKTGEGRQKALGTVTAEPCPFCTSSDVIPHVAEGRTVMRCEDCGASGPVCIDELNAVRSWNRRPATLDQDWD
ncbi:hypothetical protein EN845_01165 [Mesorhizobium sp. M8A.F.Ca.ET.202.01.1.1]|nr:hypothetical protein EN840_01165 [Mesorhizobium sp. M8A.F.Ca.ET.197.01.1.1]TGR34620.1 hypothetical protein EN845_01165 [Mesorhizobium sp. M8A.F.Ca.ET.202.01.1.1]TGR58232.1 hypothetical protein EN842_01165 [bacterium M00.F.Ca.ET.199.01.1.1]TGR59163.1 hypothetical protein EN841_01165 [Mesorhizobium sp. M8A.F.Ca.ET.198.01.1.1]TGU41660.1 hypothetical protein EN799_03650 [bacterium M00.F.Ca.ET.156.01.1.1]TGV89716.1 hypothetical protein EN792_006035 [Mesorhizobium sp. M00.F.Ca.ET.149.01.1.1]